jgi:3-isopropylmalate/(R)-2-methylmalate dehydratase small subunit
MHPIRHISGRAAPLPGANIDTDVIMPKQFLKGITREGLADGVFFDLRFAAPDKPRPDFILNTPGYAGTQILVAGPNFGCGSSREHAVWGLRQFGIRAILGTTFGSIFFDNCLHNGLLVIRLADAETQRLLALCAKPDRNLIAIDLVAQTVADAEGQRTAFAIDALSKDRLLRGIDSIAATLERAAAIRAFEKNHRNANPWQH